MSDEALSSAIKAAGGATALGRALRITHAAILKWKRTPAERVLEVERITGVSRHDLRPDIYPRSERSPEADQTIAGEESVA